jgi:hypothetical protein
MKTAIAMLALLIGVQPCFGDSMFANVVRPRIGAKCTTPQRASLPLGVAAVVNDRALLLEMEPGLAGGKVNIGWGFVLPKSENILFLKGSVLRTWDDPLGGVPTDTTYLGGELEFTGFEAIIVNVGAYTRVDEGSDDRVILSAGVGIAFW